ncbi:MAG: hypothetical protein B7X47_05325 [Ferrovum sp. 34-44-207]|nr:MAG: hypothetical protein B7Z65_07765 [Ferrovum sp. 21-44-67]OZB32997.1 MAG: hypothetical protein B7X47_05325 [Ferrovum sp. 34-44-207]HQU07411.1 hypothetical protein [Ferrovaceae bacterium]
MASKSIFNPIERPLITEIAQLDRMSYDQMRIEFLRLSPAYALMAAIKKKPIELQNDLILKFYESNSSALARRKFLKTSNRKFTKDQRNRILAGFDFVRKTHKEYGDISKSYEAWISGNENAIYLLNYHHLYPSTHLIAIEREHGQPLARFAKDMNAYLDSIEEGKHIHEPRIVVSIPVNANFKVVTQDIKQWMREYSLPNANRQYVSAKPLIGKRVHYEATLKKLHLLMHKTLRPHEPLWKLGLRARVSDRYNKLAHKDLSGDKLSKDDKDILSATTSRTLKQAQYIAENAARGLFPLHKRIITPEFDYEELKKRLLKAWPDLIVK